MDRSLWSSKASPNLFPRESKPNTFPETLRMEQDLVKPCKEKEPTVPRGDPRDGSGFQRQEEI